MRKILLSGAIALLIFQAGRALAAGRQPPVNPFTPFLMENSRTFAYRSVEDDHGGFYILWTHESPPGLFSLQAQHVGPVGQLLWSQTGQSLATNLTSVENWDAFSDGQGGLVTAWIESDHPLAQRYDATGKALWRENASVTISSAPCLSPVGVADAVGGAYLVWSEKRYPDRWVLMTQHMTPDGKVQWDESGIRVSRRPSEQRRPRVVYDGQSGAIVAWKDFRMEASQVEAQRLDSQGNRLWGEEGIVVTAPAGPPETTPILEPLGSGGAVMAWIGQQSNLDTLFLQSLVSTGTFRWTPQGFNITFGAWDQWNPVLDTGSKGSIWTGWEDFRDGIHWQVYIGKLDSDAHMTWPDGMPLAPFTSDQGQLTIASNLRDGIFAAWTDNRLGEPGVYVQEIDPQGLPLMGTEGKSMVERLINPGRPRIVVLEPDRAALFWVDRQKKNQWALFWSIIPNPAAVTSPNNESSPAGNDTSDTAPQVGKSAGPY